MGAGGTDLPTWLAIGSDPAGRVVATDIDTSWLTGQQVFEVMRHDVATDEPPGSFDLIHARLVLTHVQRRDVAVAAMAGRCGPAGGWSWRTPTRPCSPCCARRNRDPPRCSAIGCRRGFRSLLAARGADLEFGRTLPRRLRDAGLRAVSADAYFPMTGPACAALERATVLQVRDLLMAAGLATEEEIAEHLANIATGRMVLATAPLITAWGHRADSRPDADRRSDAG